VTRAPAIELVEVEKRFRIPHENRTTIKEYFKNPFRRMTYEENCALNGVSFSIRRGEFFGIIGPNGSGKSTLLKIIAGIYVPTGGEVRVSGMISPFIELGVGFNPELTARDNVMICGTLLGLTRRELEERFDAVLAFAELERFVDQKLKNFSSGMHARLAYSIALQVDFEILLLDEVLAVGDQSFQEKCFATFDRLRAEGKTIVFVSHDLGSIARFCDRVALIEHGDLHALGPADEVIDSYLSEARVHVG
jgi:ABC-type polysaccharide/polyol phosphate transport system ATPase subunit